MSEADRPERGRGSGPNPSGSDPSASSSRGGAQELPDLVGRTVAGRYRVLELLGRGAMGAVYLARHERMGRRDALKILPRHLASDPDALARFSREARNASFIRHPNVCEVYDFGETEDGLPFLAMEYVAGETLGSLLEREGPLSPGPVIALAEQVTRALEAAHARGIVHRDLKPDNIMLTTDLDGSTVVKVVDFGIAKAIEGGDESQEVTRAGWVVGTPEYVSPEQLADGEADARSDVYSLAIVLFRALTGKLPFQGDTWRGIMTSRLTDPPRQLQDYRPDLPHMEALQAVLDRALSREPGDRPPSAAAFRQELLSAMAGDAPQPDARSALPPTRAVPGGAASPDQDRTRTADGLRTRTTSSPGFPGRLQILGASAVLALAGLAGVGAALGWFDGAAEPEPIRPPTESPATGPSSTEPDISPSSADSVTASASSDAPETATTASDDEATPSEPPTSGFVGEERVAEILFRQLSALSEDEVTLVRTRAARDTAMIAWGQDGLEAGNRALAAYVAASALQAMDRADDALPWAERAVELAPDNQGFRDLLELLRAGEP